MTEPLTLKESEAMKNAFADATKKQREAAGASMNLADALFDAHAANVKSKEAIEELKRVQVRIAKARNKNLEDIIDFERDGVDFSGVVFKTEGETK